MARKKKEGAPPPEPVSRIVTVREDGVAGPHLHDGAVRHEFVGPIPKEGANPCPRALAFAR